MFVNSDWRRRLQAYVGPGHGRRRDFGMPDRRHGRDTEVADTGRDTTRRDPATGHTARDPATDDTARDEPSGTRSGDGRYGTRRAIRDAIRRRARRHAIRRRARRHATIIFYPTMSGCPMVRLPGGAVARWCGRLMMFSYVRLCSLMSGYVRLPGLFRTVCRRGVIGSFVRHEP